MAACIGRRDFITLAAWPLAALAQQPATPMIGYLSARSPDECSGWRHIEGPPKPRFRTFQVCPKDLRAALRQAEGAED
jgi:hypothetical protein